MKEEKPIGEVDRVIPRRKQGGKNVPAPRENASLHQEIQLFLAKFQNRLKKSRTIKAENKQSIDLRRA